MKPNQNLIDLGRRVLDGLRDRPCRVFGLFLAMTALLSWPTLLNRPVWDEAFSIFPAADFLAHHGFNARALLKQPGFIEAGPTTHGMTLPAWYTAVVLKITGGGRPAWIILHLWQWLLAAGIGTLLTRIVERTHGLGTGLLIGALSLYCPLMLTQIGNMYLEVALLFFCVWALHAFLRGRLWMAALAGALACATKESGFISVIALALVAWIIPKPSWKGAGAAARLVVPSMFVLIVLHWFQRGSASELAAMDEPVLRRCWIFLVQAYNKYLAMMPDMLALFVLALVIGTWQFIRISRQAFRGGVTEEQQPAARLVWYCSLLVLGFAGFHFVVWAMFANLSNFASRYLVFILPAMWILLAFALRNRFGARVPPWALGGLLVLLLINRHGLFYPPLVTCDIGVAERSAENLDGVAVQKEYMHFLERNIPSNVPIFYDLPEAYLGQYPVLGYVSKPLTNGVLISRFARTRGAKLDQCPDRFYLIYFFPIVGSRELLGIYHEALGRPDWRTEDVATFSRGGFKAFVVLIERKANGETPEENR